MALACASHACRFLLAGQARSFPRPALPCQGRRGGVPERRRERGGGARAKLEEAVGGDLQRLLEARTLRLKKLGIPCKHRKLILSFAHKYRLGLWKPKAEPRKVE
uniref:Small ribosomal subunit protein mS41 SAM domain-containing protein n=1 Tax=Zea mays TaxID=4577 RepID=B6T197_MAIZE|nr:hypothetical protein [Zea mays]